MSARFSVRNNFDFQHKAFASKKRLGCDKHWNKTNTLAFVPIATVLCLPCNTSHTDAPVVDAAIITKHSNVVII